MFLVAFQNKFAVEEEGFLSPIFFLKNKKEKPKKKTHGIRYSCVSGSQTKPEYSQYFGPSFFKSKTMRAELNRCGRIYHFYKWCVFGVFRFFSTNISTLKVWQQRKKEGGKKGSAMRDSATLLIKGFTLARRSVVVRT